MLRYLVLFLSGLVLTGFYLHGKINSQIKPLQQASTAVINELATQSYVDKILASDGKYDPLAQSAVWFDKKVSLPPADLAQRIMQAPKQVLGESTGNKWIDVDLTSQRLFAHEGDKIVYDFPISSGLPGMPTVTGEYYIWSKVKSQRMKGGSVDNGTYYDLPNVPFVQFFYKGYSFHGAYWHNDFGKPRSHGCVNLRIADAQLLFDWTEPTLAPNQYALYNIKPEETVKVVIHGQTPQA